MIYFDLCRCICDAIFSAYFSLSIFVSRFSLFLYTKKKNLSLCSSINQSMLAIFFHCFFNAQIEFVTAAGGFFLKRNSYWHRASWSPFISQLLMPITRK